MGSTREKIRRFLESGPVAVAGASRDRSKFGNRVLLHYLRAGWDAHPVNPREDEIEGRRAYPDLASLPAGVRGLSIVTPPAITERLVEEAAEAGIRLLWMQPGAESARAVARAEELGLDCIHGGPCVLVELS